MYSSLKLFPEKNFLSSFFIVHSSSSAALQKWPHLRILHTALCHPVTVVQTFQCILCHIQSSIMFAYKMSNQILMFQLRNCTILIPSQYWQLLCIYLTFKKDHYKYLFLITLYLCIRP